MRITKISVAVAMILAGTTSLYAQESLIGHYAGTYSGTYQGSRGENRPAIELTIVSVDNGIVKGTARRSGKQCMGDYPLEGTYNGNELVLESGKGGKGGDCTTKLQLAAKGNKLTGTLQGQYPVDLTKK
jgi:hypothetical protein